MLCFDGRCWAVISAGMGGKKYRNGVAKGCMWKAEWPSGCKFIFIGSEIWVGLMGCLYVFWMAGIVVWLGATLPACLMQPQLSFALPYSGLRLIDNGLRLNSASLLQPQPSFALDRSCFS